MEPEKAIDYIMDHCRMSAIVFHCDTSDCSNCEYRTAVEALGKQIPIAPHVIKSYPHDLELCGACGSTFITGAYGANMRYCPNCGQAVKWGE